MLTGEQSLIKATVSVEGPTKIPHLLLDTKARHLGLQRRSPTLKRFLNDIEPFDRRDLCHALSTLVYAIRGTDQPHQHCDIRYHDHNSKN